jgi:dihydropteroate synthase
MAAHADYRDVVREVVDELGERVARAREAGVARLLVDPGLGFAKTGEHNLALLAHLDALAALGCPIVVGASRKSFLGKLTGKQPRDREAATAAAHAIAIAHGANVVRVHDVAAQRDAILVADAIRSRR